jgi:hypothetical protein
MPAGMILSVYFLILFLFVRRVKINKKKEAPVCMRKICIAFLILIGMGLITGCIHEEDSFMTTDVTFCTDEPSDRSYEQNTDHTYCRGEPIWIYLECFRFTSTEDNGEYSALFNTTLEIFDHTGACVHTRSQLMEIPTTADPVYIWLKFWIKTDTLTAGTYTLSLTVEDTLGGEQSISRGEFHIISC